MPSLCLAGPQRLPVERLVAGQPMTDGAGVLRYPER